MKRFTPLWVFLFVFVGADSRCAHAFSTPITSQKRPRFTNNDEFLSQPHSKPVKIYPSSSCLGMKGDADQEQAMEALRSLTDFHQGKWDGKTSSFTVTADVAAGIIQKRISKPYELDVKLSYSPAGVLAINEMYSWQSDDDKTISSPRSLSIADSNVDCDSVDSSYSLQTSNQPDYLLSMADLTGTDKEVHFAVEQCIAVSDDARVRLWVLYGEKQELVRVVVCDETRVPESSSSSSSGAFLSATDILELETDVDRLVDKIAGQVKGATPGPTKSSENPPTASPDEQEERLQRLQESLARQSSAPQQQQQSPEENDGTPLSRHPMSLLELTSGVWLGDSIIRDFPTGSRTDSKATGQGSGKGFGASSSKIPNTNSGPPSFGSWVVGVQKVAREWLWDFGEQIRQNNDAGKCVGVEMEPALAESMAGSVCENQSLSRRIPKEERMVYIDWNDGNGDNHVGFLLGSVSIQVPRFLTFGSSQQSKPFFTELCVYQSVVEEEKTSAAAPVMDATTGELETEIPTVVCSRICRLYNTEGQLKQGCTSFYTLRRFEEEPDSNNPIG